MPPTYGNRAEEVLLKARAKIDRAQQLEGENMTPDDVAEHTRLLREADDLLNQAKRLKKVEEIAEAQFGSDDEQKADTWGFKNVGDFLGAVYKQQIYGHTDSRLRKSIDSVKDLSDVVGVSGGFAVPPGFENSLISLGPEQEIIMPRARRYTMTSRTLRIPAVDVSVGASGQSASFGGFSVSYVDENTDATEDQPAFKAIELEAKKALGYAEIPSELLEDAPMMESELSNLVSGALAWQRDYDFINGTGAGQPLGILNADALIDVTRATGGNDVDIVDLVSMKSRLLTAFPGSNPVWIMNQSVMPSIYRLESSGGAQAWIFNLGGAGPETMLGYPIRWTEKTPATGSAGDVLLVDPQAYAVGVRTGVAVEFDRSHKFKSDQIALRVRMRFDGQPQIRSSVTLADGTSTVSPFVRLS